MRRTTMRDLEGLVNRLNRITGNPETSYTKDASGKFTANIGNYHLDGAYGGWQLSRIQTLGGGITNPLHTGFVSKRELYQAIDNFIRGIDQGITIEQENQANFVENQKKIIKKKLKV